MGVPASFRIFEPIGVQSYFGSAGHIAKPRARKLASQSLSFELLKLFSLAYVTVPDQGLRPRGEAGALTIASRYHRHPQIVLRTTTSPSIQFLLSVVTAYVLFSSAVLLLSIFRIGY